MTTGATSYRRTWLALARLDLDRLARPALAVAVIASGLLLLHLTRGTSFWADEWIWITTRRGNTADAFLAPYNGHLSLVPIAIYRLMFAVFGIGGYTPYRALVIGLSLVVAVLVFVYARSRWVKCWRCWPPCPYCSSAQVGRIRCGRFRFRG